MLCHYFVDMFRRVCPHIQGVPSQLRLTFIDTVGQIPPEDGADEPRHVGEITV
jgi:hypothetical protein